MKLKISFLLNEQSFARPGRIAGFDYLARTRERSQHRSCTHRLVRTPGNGVWTIQDGPLRLAQSGCRIQCYNDERARDACRVCGRHDGVDDRPLTAHATHRDPLVSSRDRVRTPATRGLRTPAPSTARGQPSRPSALYNLDGMEPPSRGRSTPATRSPSQIGLSPSPSSVGGVAHWGDSFGGDDFSLDDSLSLSMSQSPQKAIAPEDGWGFGGGMELENANSDDSGDDDDGDESSDDGGHGRTPGSDSEDDSEEEEEEEEEEESESEEEEESEDDDDDEEEEDDDDDDDDDDEDEDEDDDTDDESDEV